MVNSTHIRLQGTERVTVSRARIDSLVQLIITPIEIGGADIYFPAETALEVGKQMQLVAEAILMEKIKQTTKVT